MKVINYEEIPGVFINNDQAKGVTGRVAIGQKDGAKNFCMRVFELEPGGYTPIHAHNWEHEIFIHKGEGKVWKENEWIDIKAGTVVFIPPGERHQLKNTGTIPLVFVCLIPAGPPEL